MRSRFPSALLLLLFAMACSRASVQPTPTLPHSPTATESPTETLTAFPVLRPSFRLIDTGVMVGLAYGNISWSHSGEQIAYIFDSRVWTVPVGRWSEEAERCCGYLIADAWHANESTVAWSPDDRKIGFGAAKYIGTHERTYRMAQVDIESGEMSFVGPEKTTFLDWSDTDEIVGVHNEEPYELVVLDVRTGELRTLIEPSGRMKGYFTPRWTREGKLLLAEKSGSDYDYSARFYEVDWRENRWEWLPIFTAGRHRMALRPVASPDRRWIAWLKDDVVRVYDRQRGGFWSVAYSQNGSDQWRALTWAPDSKRLALSARARVLGAQTLWILEPDLPE